MRQARRRSSRTPRTGRQMMRLPALLLATVLAVPALAVEYRSVDTATILYDAPSPKGRKLFVVKRGTPVELVVHLDGWAKVRDSEGGLAWLESASLGMNRAVIVTVARAMVRASGDESAPLVFEAEKDVVLDYLEMAPGGWVQVRHRDGQTGFVRADQVWGI